MRKRLHVDYVNVKPIGIGAISRGDTGDILKYGRPYVKTSHPEVTRRRGLEIAAKTTRGAGEARTPVSSVPVVNILVRT